MRKFTASLLLSLFVFALNAQMGFVPSPVLSKAQNEIPEHIKKTNVTPRTENIIWEHHFEGELWSGTSVDGVAVPEEAPEGWSLTDATGNDFYWRWDTVGPRGNFTSPSSDCHEPQVPLISETAHNGFMMLEANYYNTPDDCDGIFEELMDAAVVYEAGIDFSSYGGVRLQFTQWNRFCCSWFTEETDAFFEISTDNGDTWISKSVSLAPRAEGNPNTGDISEVDITDMVAGESNVQFRFRLANFSHYLWVIDDVYFIEPYAYDLKALDYWNNFIDDYIPEYGLYENDFVEGYYYYPWFMTQNFASYSIAFQNYGYTEQTGINYHVEITKNGVAIENFSSAVPNLSHFEIDSAKIVENFMPEGKGHYSIRHYMTSGNPDQNPANDTLSRDFVVSTDILAAVNYKNPTLNTRPSRYNGFEDGYGLGTKFRLPSPSLHGDGNGDYFEVNGVEFYLTNQQGNADALALIESGGASMYAELYRFNEETEEWILITSSNEYVASLEDTSTFVYLPFATDGTSEILVQGGTYLVNLSFNGTYIDANDRNQSIYIGGNGDHKMASESNMLVPPGATPPEDVWRLREEYMGLALHANFSDPYPYTEYETTITVTSMGSGTPIQDATVTIAGVQVETNVDGNAVFMLEDGSYPITVEKDNFGTVAEEFIVQGAEQTIPIQMVGVSTINKTDFNIYPNPSNGEFSVEVDGNATVTVMNVAGQVVDSRTISGSQTITLDNVNSGVYFVRVQIGEDVATKQLIIR
jgi:hypothetical protein